MKVESGICHAMPNSDIVIDSSFIFTHIIKKKKNIGQVSLPIKRQNDLYEKKK
jgi:hypothetical protein